MEINEPRFTEALKHVQKHHPYVYERKAREVIQNLLRAQRINNGLANKVSISRVRGRILMTDKAIPKKHYDGYNSLMIKYMTLSKESAS